MQRMRNGWGRRSRKATRTSKEEFDLLSPWSITERQPRKWSSPQVSLPFPVYTKSWEKNYLGTILCMLLETGVCQSCPIISISRIYAVPEMFSFLTCQLSNLNCHMHEIVTFGVSAGWTFFKTCHFPVTVLKKYCCDFLLQISAKACNHPVINDWAAVYYATISRTKHSKL